jgi:xanthomonalisin
LRQGPRWGLALCLLGALAGPLQGRQVLSGHVRAALKSRPVVDAVPDTLVLHLAIGLPLRDPAGLAQLRRDLGDPASPRYRHFLSTAAFTAEFGPSLSDYQALIAFAQRQGFTVTRTYRSQALLGVSGPVAAVKRAFQVGLNRYRRDDGTLCFSVDREPSLDLDLPVAHISGLDDLVAPRSCLHAVPSAAAPAPGSGSGLHGHFLGDDLRVAYAGDVSLRGDGQQVGLLEFDTYPSADVSAYRAASGLSGTTALRNVYVDGLGPLTQPGGGLDEVVLDIDMVTALAPAATVVVYMGVNADDVLAAMADDASLPLQFSSSWYWGALSDNARNSLAQCAVQGQSFFQASGDQAAYVDGTSLYPNDSGSTVPLSGSIMDQPDVTVVGGTRLSMTGSGTGYASETTWYRDLAGSPMDLGSGGGISPDEPLPWFQLGVPGGASGASAQGRDLPDVSAVADDLMVYLTEPGASQASYAMAGTSASAPLWAGFTALVNQQAALQGLPALGAANAPLYSVAQSAGYAACFHDVADGSVNGPYHAVAGYDLCTGWGSPKGMALIHALLVPGLAGVAAAGAAGAGGGRLLTYPNPYRPSRSPWIKLSFPMSAAKAVLSVYDAGYRRVAQLALDESQAVLGAALYCGCDDGGKSLPPGTYYAVLQGGGAPLRCTFTVLP